MESNIALAILQSILLISIAAVAIFAGRPRKYAQTYEVFQHVKTGGQYAVLYTGHFEADAKPCVIYTSVESLERPTPWVRNYNEFHDGRFAYVGTITITNGKRGKLVCA